MNESLNITCPKCGAEFPLTDAVSHRLRAQIQTEFDRKLKEHNAALEARERKLQQERQDLEKQALSLQAQVEERLKTERERLSAEAAAHAQEKLAVQMTDLQERLARQDQQLKQAREAQLDLLKKKAAAEEARENLKLELTKQLDAERAAIAERARQQAIEAERLKLADKEQIIQGLQKQIADLQQRANQGSMQLQGESLEVSLESDLRHLFPSDEITEVKKGERGADIKQQVRTPAGLVCGTILWESKRAKNWQPAWIEKLKEDQRNAKAELAVLVATCPPQAVRGIGRLEDIWVCEPTFACALAAALREGLLYAARQRAQDSGRADKATLLYDYICSVEFRQHLEGLDEAFRALDKQIADERRAFEKQWAERKAQLDKAIKHTIQIYGSVQGIAGRTALPDPPSLQLPGAQTE
jgi:hypothetical protein